MDYYVNSMKSYIRGQYQRQYYDKKNKSNYCNGSSTHGDVFFGRM